MGKVKVGKPKNQDSVKEIVHIFNNDYKTATKAFVWGKAINEWGRIIFGGGIFLVVALILFVPIFVEFRKDHATMNKAKVDIAAHLEEIVRFLDTGKRSMERRQELLKSLMETVNTYADKGLDQKTVERKLSILSKILQNCMDARRTFISEFAECKNPQLNPELSASFDKLIADGSIYTMDKPSIITLQEENTEWGNLCQLCENEIRRAEREQRQTINAQANTSESSSLGN